MRELVSAVAGLHSEALSKVRIFPRGIIHQPMYLMMRALVSAPDIGAIIDRLLNTKVVRSVVIFPYGLLATEGFQIDVSVGGSAEASGVVTQAGD